MKGIGTTVILAAIAIPAAVLAAPGDARIDHRQQNQQARIHQGAASGDLTRGETRRLQAEQRHIRQDEHRYRADGQLTGRERRDLQRDLNRASRDIYNQRHDAQTRPPAAVRDPGVNERQRWQHARIQQGVRSGELTRDERKTLATEQRSIRQQEHLYRSDGVLTRDERRDLHQDLATAGRNIYDEKHDAERRY